MMKFFMSILAGFSLVACASSGKSSLATFPKSSLETPKKTGDGTAVAFQFLAPGCVQGGFDVTPRLGDDKFGETTRITFVRSILGLNFAPNDVDKFQIDAANSDRLHAKLLPAGTYVATRPTCTRANTRYFTARDKLVSFFEFELEPGKTNYIGAVRITQTRQLLILTAKDQSGSVSEEYDKRYSDKSVGPLHTSTAKGSMELIASTK